MPATWRDIGGVDRALAVASALGASTHFKGFAPEKILAGAGPDKFNESGDYAVIHPGAAWPNKQYPADRWGAVAAELGRRTGWKILISAATPGHYTSPTLWRFPPCSYTDPPTPLARVPMEHRKERYGTAFPVASATEASQR